MLTARGSARDEVLAERFSDITTEENTGFPTILYEIFFQKEHVKIHSRTADGLGCLPNHSSHPRIIDYPHDSKELGSLRVELCNLPVFCRPLLRAFHFESDSSDLSIEASPPVSFLNSSSDTGTTLADIGRGTGMLPPFHRRKSSFAQHTDVRRRTYTPRIHWRFPIPQRTYNGQGT